MMQFCCAIRICVSGFRFLPGFFLLLFGILAVGSFSLPAAAVTLTFDAVENEGGGFGPESIVEQDITISNFPESHTVDGRIHIDDAGTAISQFIDFSSANPFDALEVLVNGIQSFIVENPQTFQFELTPYENVLFTGYRGGMEVASQTAIAAGGVDQVISFNADFTALDMLRISALGPDPGDFEGFSECFDIPCGHFDIDNLVLLSSITVIPLPASLFLLISGIAAISVIARKGRRTYI